MLRAVIALLLLTSCHHADPPMNEVERIMADAERAMEADPCMRREGDVWQHVGWRNCLKFKPAERMYGVWYYGFEESGFVPNIRTVDLDRNVIEDRHRPEFDIDLDIDSEAATRHFQLPVDGYGCTHAIAIEFVGRQSEKAGLDETGTEKGVIVVDRLLSARLIGRVRDKIYDPPACG